MRESQSDSPMIIGSISYDRYTANIYEQFCRRCGKKIPDIGSTMKNAEMLCDFHCAEETYQQLLAQRKQKEREG